MLTSINEALDYVDEMIIGEKPWQQAIANPLQRFPFVHVKSKRALQSTTASIKSFCSQFRSSAGTWSRRMGAVLGVEAAVILLLHFYVFTQVPIWLMIIPLLAFDYIALAMIVLYLKLKMNRNRNKLSRKLVLNPPNIPRTTATSVTSATAASSDCSAHTSIDLGMQGELTQLKTVQPQMLIPDYNSGSACTPPRLLLPPAAFDSVPLQPAASAAPFFDDPLDLVENEVRHHFQQEAPRLQKRKPSRRERLRLNGCVTSPVGYDVFLSVLLRKSGLTYTSAIMCDKEMRIPLLHTASHILYYIPSYRTFLSGMIEIAYFIGHSDWEVTVCVPSEAECLVLMDGTQHDEATRRAVERRNECYNMAWKYLSDMARRRECRVFRNVEDAIKHIAVVSRRENDKKAVLRSLVEKQHLVKEKTQANLLAHRSAVIAAATAAAASSPSSVGK
ncbi:Raw [Aphelenchoides fujianensis]|nr:Raw [Aphelenchoides fujianensis]